MKKIVIALVTALLVSTSLMTVSDHAVARDGGGCTTSCAGGN